MRWSQLKSAIEARFAKSLAGRIQIHSTRYGAMDTHGRAWLTVDKVEVANFCTRAYSNRAGGMRISGKSLKKYATMPVAYGEISRQDVHRACWAFLHELSIEKALEEDDALIQTLAVLDRRLGKRRLGALDERTLHPLAQALLNIRLEAEGITPNKRPKIAP